jgi:hypothetical protein
MISASLPSQPTTVEVQPWSAFRYVPPASARSARRIVVKPNLGYPVGPPVTVSDTVLFGVLAALRDVAPSAELVVLEGVCSKASLAQVAELRGLLRKFDAQTVLLDADAQPLADYPHTGPAAARFRTLQAPALLREADCRITVGACKRTMLNGRPLFSGSLKNLFGLFPRATYHARSPHSRGQLHRPSVPRVLEDVWWTVGHLFDGAVVDGGQFYAHHDWHPDRARAGTPCGRVWTGTDPVSVDSAAATAVGEGEPDYCTAIRHQRGW